MLFLNPLDTVLGQNSKVKILRFLIRTEAELNGREIAKAVGLSHVKCHSALQELVPHGFVSMRRIGKSTVYHVEMENFLVKELLKPLFDKEQQLLNGLVKLLLSGLSFQPRTIVLFGSLAKGQARPDSDIDLLVVIPNGESLRKAKGDFGEIEEKVIKSYGNRLAPVIIKEKELFRKYRQPNPFYKEIVKTGRVIWGKPLLEILR